MSAYPRKRTLLGAIGMYAEGHDRSYGIPSHSITLSARTSSVGGTSRIGPWAFRSAHNHGVLSDPGTERPMKALESWGLRKAAERMA
jgi:hypothetical protein